MSLNTVLHELLDGAIHPNRRGELHDLVDAAVPKPAEAAEPADGAETGEGPAQAPDVAAGA